MGSIAENALTFMSYGFFKRMVGVKGTCFSFPFHVDPDKMTFTQMTLSSMGSGMTISFLLTPVELLKCRLQVPFLSGGDVNRLNSLRNQHANQPHLVSSVMP